MTKDLPYQNNLISDRQRAVKQALEEDIQSGDITAALIPATEHADATIISREHAIICGQDWVNEVFSQLTEASTPIQIEWLIQEGDAVKPDQPLVKLSGQARTLLTGERTALNFMQTLSATATTCHHMSQLVAHTPVKLLDTRKTIPGLRTAQKYAALCGGCHNHRIGLYDAFLIKENHIMSAGSISTAVKQARALEPSKPVEVEVENLRQLEEALQAKSDIIMLDNFSLDDISAAVKLTNGTARLEVSGNVSEETIVPLAETGVDFISIGGLTKHIKAIDLSMRFAMY